MSIALASTAERPDRRPEFAPRSPFRRGFREILVHCNDPENWPLALDYALLFGAPGETRLTRFREDGHASRFDACDIALRSGPATAPTALEIARHAAWADVIVRDHPGTAADLYDWVAGSGRPCIVLPARLGAARPPRRVAIGWNGSLEAARALHAALPLLRTADEVVLYDSTLYRRDQRASGIDVGTYLSMQGVAIERIDSASMPDDSMRAALAVATDHRADLLVLGAFRHQRFNGWDANETLQHALRAGSVPLFLAH